MSGRGCQLLVSPCNMSPAMSVMGGHRSSPQTVTQKVNKRVHRSFASESQNGSHVVLPSLCLRRQVLTIPARPPHEGGPAHPGPSGACSYRGTRFRNCQINRHLLWFEKRVWRSTAHSGIDN